MRYAAQQRAEEMAARWAQDCKQRRRYYRDGRERLAPQCIIESISSRTALSTVGRPPYRALARASPWPQAAERRHPPMQRTHAAFLRASGTSSPMRCAADGPVRSVFRSSSLPQVGPQVLGANLKCSESEALGGLPLNLPLGSG